MAPPFLELGTIGTHDLDQYDHHLFNYLESQSSFSSTTSSLSSPIFLSPPHQVQPPISDHRYYREPQNFKFQLLEADHHIVSYGGSLCDHDQGRGNESVVNFSVDDHSKSGAKDQQRIHENRSTTSHGENVSVKWMSSKMRIMKKMNSQDHTTTAARVNNFEFEEQQIKVHPSSSPPPSGITESSNNAAPIRVCSDCNTTKTPLWRSGPRGPKSLCNACGIRQRKARRAMAAAAAAAAAANGGTAESVAAPSVIKTSTTKVKIKDNKTIPFKKRCHKLTSTTTSPSPRAKSSSSSKTTTKLHFEDFSISTMNQNNSGTPPPPPSAATAAFQRAFPQDEKEAAILLMALSCGLVQG